MNDTIRYWKGQAVISIKQLTKLWNIDTMQVKMALTGCTDGDFLTVTKEDNDELKEAGFTLVSRDSNGYPLLTRYGAYKVAQILKISQVGLSSLTDYFDKATPEETHLGADAEFLLRGETIIYNDIIYPVTPKYEDNVAVTHETAAEMFGITSDMVAGELSQLAEKRDYFIIRNKLERVYAEQAGYKFKNKDYPLYMITATGLIKLASSFNSPTSWDIMSGALELWAAGLCKKKEPKVPSLTEQLNTLETNIINHINGLVEQSQRVRKVVTKIRDHVWQDNNGTFYIDENWVVLPNLHKIEEVARYMKAYTTVSLNRGEQNLAKDAIGDFIVYVLGHRTKTQLYSDPLIRKVYQSHNIMNGDLVRDGVPEPRLTDEGFEYVCQYWQEHRDEFVLADNTMRMWPGCRCEWKVTFLDS